LSFEGPLHLVLGDQQVVILPRFGGRIAAYRTIDAGSVYDWLRPVPEHLPIKDALRQGGSYPLLPYGNRIAHGRFPWRGRTIELPAWPSAAPHSLHGVGWQRSWRILNQQAAEAQLDLTHAGDQDWPWQFRAWQSIALSPDGLYLTVQFTNEDEEAQPVGLGFHPFFPVRPDLRLQFAASRFWAVNHNNCPTAHQPVPDPLDFAIGKPAIDGIDDCFGGVSTRSLLTWSGGGIAVETSASLPFMQLYTRLDQGFFCFEPVSHAPNAVNMAPPEDEIAGIRTLAPGDSFSVTMVLRPFRD
jgi:aldose 1-epimerase